MQILPQSMPVPLEVTVLAFCSNSAQSQQCFTLLSFSSFQKDSIIRLAVSVVDIRVLCKGRVNVSFKAGVIDVTLRLSAGGQQNTEGPSSRELRTEKTKSIIPCSVPR